MNLIFLFSVVLKGLGAVLEILLQILITGHLGVSGYGTYSAWINFADLLFWVAFSGLVKCNTFYLSSPGTSIKRFRHAYYLRYALPMLGLAAGMSVVLGSGFLPIFIPVITLLELLVMDNSSTLLTRGKGITSLIGEYVLGRLLLVIGVVILRLLELLSLRNLLILYVLQYGFVLLFFHLRQKNHAGVCDVSKDVSVKKWVAYQRSDLMHSMIDQMPVVMQFCFSGAFSAGVVSVVLLVKKLINFISGPMSKIFLPEFSRLYKEGEKEKIFQVYGSIMRIQMLAVGPMAVVLLGFPRVVLRILAEELVSYDWLFMRCSVIFLVMATLGPCSGIMLMTGNEKKHNLIRGCALGLMAAVMLLTCRDPYFVLYGLCMEVLAEGIAKYTFICRWMKKAPVTIAKYLGFWALPALAVVLSHLLKLGDSFLMMILFAGSVFALFGLQELRENKVFKRK